MVTYNFKLLALFNFVVTSHLSFAGEIFWHLKSPRSLGRGGTFTAAHDSDEAQRMNPATLSTSEISYQLKLLQSDFILGENTLDTITDIINVASSGNFGDILKEFDTKFGKQQYTRAQISLLGQRFGDFEVFPYFTNETWLMMESKAIPSLAWQSETIAGFMFTYSDAFPNSKTLYWGVNFTPHQRFSVTGDIDLIDLFEFLPPSSKSPTDIIPIKSGFGISIDTGMLWIPSQTFQLGFTIHNLGNSLEMGEASTKPTPISQKISAGVLYRQEIGYEFQLDYSFDIQNILNPEGLPFIRLLHFGLELGTSYVSRDQDFGVQMGINDGYLSFGTFIDLFLFRLDIMNYGSEVEHNPGQLQDRRWAYSLKSSMTF